MATHEPAPDYEGEKRGVERLDGILQLMQRDEYPHLLHKAAYAFCSIIDGHHFSNGNKRLAVSVLIFTLLLNGVRIHAPNMEIMESELQRFFPNLKWDDSVKFTQPHEYFFYHLALIIADRSQKGEMTFSQEQEAVVELLRVVVL